MCEPTTAITAAVGLLGSGALNSAPKPPRVDRPDETDGDEVQRSRRKARERLRLQALARTDAGSTQLTGPSGLGAPPAGNLSSSKLGG